MPRAALSFAPLAQHRRPLSQKEMFEDFSQDHAKKTVTMETNPHTGITMASIHPCRHANVMTRIIDNLAEKGRDELQVHMYALCSSFPLQARCLANDLPSLLSALFPSHGRKFSSP